MEQQQRPDGRPIAGPAHQPAHQPALEPDELTEEDLEQVNGGTNYRPSVAQTGVQSTAGSIIRWWSKHPPEG